jgi:alkanesulfonate monooxygenase
MAGARPEPQFSWFIPIDGDGDRIGTLRAQREPTFDELRRVAQTAEAAGYRSLLVPTRFANGLFEERAPLAETWTIATALAAVTERIRFLVAVRPGFISTGLFAQMAATLSRLSGGRLDLNVVPGGIQGDFERLGDASSHDDRYARGEDFIRACRALWESPGQPVDFEGAGVRLHGAICSPGPVPPGPAFYLGGASDAALALAARQADVLLAWIQPLDAMASLLERARVHYQQAGREPRFGLRTHLVVEATEARAWEAAGQLISEADPRVMQQRDAAFAGTAMVGQQAQSIRVDDDRLGERLWNGISRVRVNCGTAIVGTPDQVADELAAYWRLGFDEFILSAYPHAEGAERVARDVLPLARDRMAAAMA